MPQIYSFFLIPQQYHLLHLEVIIVIYEQIPGKVVKIGRDKQVKWILAPSKGWEKPLASKLLKSVDANGKPITCNENGLCENSDFDFTYTLCNKVALRFLRASATCSESSRVPKVA